MMRTKSYFENLLGPALFTLAIIGLLELAIQVRFAPTFWDRSGWLLHDPYRGGELFDRVVVYEKLSKLLTPDVKIISVGDSSGFFSLQAKIVNRYTHGLKFVNLSTGANQGFVGYKGNAEFALKSVSGIKYVVLYMYPSLVPSEKLFAAADLAPILYDDLVGLKSKLMPPSASFSKAAKTGFFEWRRAAQDEPLSNHKVAIEFSETVTQSLGWVPEHDIRFDRVDGRNMFHSDDRRGWYHRLLGIEVSAFNATLRDFRDMVKSYGAELVVVFAPVSPRIVSAADKYRRVAIAKAMGRFKLETPDVHFLTPYLTRFSAEKFAQFNHIAREYSHISSARLGGLLQELILHPHAEPALSSEYEPPESYPAISWKVQGPADRRLLDAAMAFFRYTSTGDDSYRAYISKRVLDIIDVDEAFGFGMAEARERLSMLSAKNIKLGYDLSQLNAFPVQVSGMENCKWTEGAQWVMLGGVVNYSIESPSFQRSAPVEWPLASKLFVPTIMENGIPKFDGYCPESSTTRMSPGIH